VRPMTDETTANVTDEPTGGMADETAPDSAAEMTAEGPPVPPVVDGEPVAVGSPEEVGSPEVVLSPEEEQRKRRKKALLLLLLGLLAMLATIVIWYLIFRQPIPLPIPVIPESQVPAYATAVYGVQRPSGVAVNAAGDRIYVTQSEGEQVAFVLDASGNKLATMTPPASTGTSHVPVYIAIDPLTAEVYITDRPSGAIYIYNSDGAFQRTFTPAKPIPGWQPIGLAFDQQGRLYVTDFSGAFQKVLVFNRKAEVERTLGETAKLSFPNGVAVDAAGNVYVTDSNNGRLLLFGTDGEVKAQVGRGAGQGNLGLPRGVAVDDQKGRVFVVDTSGQGAFVYKVLSEDSRRLEFLGFFGGEGVSDGLFEYPMGVALDGRGRVYVADTANDRVQIWSY
jgi:DNA-binding beta-propeller fold protein YncE